MNLDTTIQVGFEKIANKNKQEKSFGFCMPPTADDVINRFGLTMDEEELVNLADDMASSMADLNSQNYKAFIDAREKFRDKIRTMLQKIQTNEEKIAKMKKAIAEI